MQVSGVFSTAAQFDQSGRDLRSRKQAEWLDRIEARIQARRKGERAPKLRTPPVADIYLGEG